MRIHNVSMMNGMTTMEIKDRTQVLGNFKHCENSGQRLFQSSNNKLEIIKLLGFCYVIVTPVVFFYFK